MPRNLKVQTPGAPAQVDESTQVPQATEPTEGQTPAQVDEAAPAPAPAPEAPKRAPKAPTNYREMRAADIDPARLTAPVLSLDGWVMPLVKVNPHPADRG